MTSKWKYFNYPKSGILPNETFKDPVKNRNRKIVHVDFANAI